MKFALLNSGDFTNSFNGFFVGVVVKQFGSATVGSKVTLPGAVVYALLITPVATDAVFTMTGMICTGVLDIPVPPDRNRCRGQR